jgi:catechol 2,3-dioxygenase-like lactoylglutathione lyase family enzyme
MTHRAAGLAQRVRSTARARNVGGMITGVHALVHAQDADAARAFFRDVVGWPHVDAHDGWLIFGTGPSELGVHPADGGAGHHEISLVCDDIELTVAELSARGALFAGGIEQRGFGRTIALEVPGGGRKRLSGWGSWPRPP